MSDGSQEIRILNFGQIILFPAMSAEQTKEVMEGAEGPRVSLPLPILPMPKTRGECEGGPRPCMYTQCRYNLMFDVDPENFLEYSCALDTAEDGERSLSTLADIFGLSRERVRQIEQRALRKLGETNFVATLRREDRPRKRKPRPLPSPDEWDDDLDL